MTADPKKEEYAFPLPQLSYQEAMEMSHFGAKILHFPIFPPPYGEKNIPLLDKE